jgi:hypothetical protein
MKLAEIGHYGEYHVVAALVGEGFQCRRSTRPKGTTDIKARKRDKSRLVQVRTSVKATGLSSAERRKLVGRAKKLGYEPWLAEILVDEEGTQVGEIVWSRLH